MGRSGLRIWERCGAFSAPVLLVACASPSPEVPSESRQPRTALAQAKTMRVAPSTQVPRPRSRVSFHGRLTTPNANLAKDPDKPIFVVDITDSPSAASSVRSKPGVVSRTKHGFGPHLCIVPVGARVRFDNRDQIFHTFFSSSKGNEFDLAPMDPGNSAFIRFQKPGLVHVYCSQHSGHRASILVLPSARFARVGANGEFHFANLQRGRRVLEIWAPHIHRQAMEVFVTGKESSPFEFPIQSIPAKAGR